MNRHYLRSVREKHPQRIPDVLVNFTSSVFRFLYRSSDRVKENAMEYVLTNMQTETNMYVGGSLQKCMDVARQAGVYAFMVMKCPYTGSRSGYRYFPNLGWTGRVNLDIPFPI